MLRKKILAGFLALVLVVNSGCATVGQAFGGNAGPAIMGGTRTHANNVVDSVTEPSRDSALTLLTLVDLPLSLVFDVLLLGETIPNEIRMGGIDAGKRRRGHW